MAKSASKPSFRLKRTSRMAVLVVYFLALGVAFTYPLINHLTTGLPYTHYPEKQIEVRPPIQGDYLQLYYVMWVVKDSLWGPTPFLTDPYQFNVPGIEAPRFSLQELPKSLLYSLLAIASSDIAGYNLLILVTFALSGLGLFLLAEALTGSAWAGLMGGTLYSLFPYRVIHLLGGHPGGFAAQWIPWTLYFLLLAFRRRKAGWALAAGCCFLILGLDDMNMAYYVLLFLSPFLGLFFFWPAAAVVPAAQAGPPEKRTPIELPPSWKSIFPRLKLLAALAVPVILLFSWQLFQKAQRLDQSVIAGGRPLSVIRGYSPQWPDLLIRFHEDSERFIYPGVLALILVLSGLLLWRRKNREEGAYGERVFFVGAGFIFLLTFLLAFGPFLDEYLRLPLYRFFYSYVPLFNFPRSPTRILYLSFFLLALLAAYGTAAWQRMMRPAVFRVVALLGLLLLIMDYFPAKAPGISTVPLESPLHRTVQSRLKDGRLLAIPLWPGESSWSSIYQYYATLTRVPMINGYRPSVSRKYVEQVFKPLSPMNNGALDTAIWRLLRDWEVRYVMLHEEAFPSKVSPFPPHFTKRRLQESGFLNYVGTDGPISLYEVREHPREVVSHPVSTSPVALRLEGGDWKSRWGDQATDPEASTGKAIRSGPDRQAGYWLIGRLKNYYFPPGSYTAWFRLKGSIPSGDGVLGRLEIWDKIRQQPITGIPIPGKEFEGASRFKEVALSFDLQSFCALEPRIYTSGRGNLWFDRLSLAFAGTWPAVVSLEAEDLFHQGELIPDPEASGKQAVRARGDVPEQMLIYGPLRPLPAGSYRASCRLRVFPRETVPEARTPFLRIRISSPPGDKILGQEVLSLNRAAPGEAYQEFPVIFQLAEEGAVDLKIFYRGGVGEVWVDRIDLARY